MRQADNSAKKYELQVIGSSKELGDLQHEVLTAVSSKHYEEAVQTLEDYREKKKFYPQYVQKTRRLFEHAEELIEAIKAKKTFPNMSSLGQSQQEELHQKAREHWEDLKVSLRRLRSIEKDLAIADARSSVWVIRAVVFSTMIILFVILANEALRSMGKPFWLLVDDIVKLAMGYLFDD